MGFGDWGMTEEDKERQRRKEEEHARKLRQTEAETAAIYDQIRASGKSHADYQDWMRRTGRTDVPYEDWAAGRYVHVVVEHKLW